jgi:Pyruvate/2-oxoacid:ferredoxin oxidoreductase delta subunit
MPRRNIVEIDERKCNGCGQCVPACAEGAIQIIEGKARLVSDVYCDGLGACLGKCPQDAIRMVEREAADFDEAAVRRRRAPSAAPKVAPHGGCPGAAVRSLVGSPLPLTQRTPGRRPPVPSGEGGLVNWPIQLHLVPPEAPFLSGADVVLAADCTAFAAPDFHTGLLAGRPLLIACPKLDDAQAYVEKLTRMLLVSGMRRLTVVHMEVPCCTGLVRIAHAAQQRAGTQVPIEDVVVGVNGELTWLSPQTAVVSS